MSRDDKLVYVTNAIAAAGKIQDLYKSNLKNTNRASIMPSDIDFVKQILDILTDSFPGPRKDELSKTVNRCYEYCCAYRNTKAHLTSMQNKTPTMNDIYMILNSLKPITENRQKYYIEKMIKLCEVFN